MAATVSQVINDKGQFVATLTTNNSGTPATVCIDGLRDVCIQTRRSAGAGADTLAVTGSNDGTNFAAVVAAASTDVALSAVSASQVNHNIRQKVRYLRFTTSGTTDTYTIVVTGTTRN